MHASDWKWRSEERGEKLCWRQVKEGRSKETKESRSRGRAEQKVCSLWVWLLSARMTTGEEEEIDRNTTTNSSWMLNKRMKRREGERGDKQVIWSNPSQFVECTNELTCSFSYSISPTSFQPSTTCIIHQQTTIICKIRPIYPYLYSPKP